MWFKKSISGLMPVEEPSEKWLSRIPDGEEIMITQYRVRSGPWHRWYFGACREIGKQQEPERSEWVIDHAIRFWSGHVEVAKDHSGRVLEVAKRIAFDKLTPDQWATLWPQFEKTMIERFGFDPVKFKDTGNGWL